VIQSCKRNLRWPPFHSIRGFVALVTVSPLKLPANKKSRQLAGQVGRGGCFFSMQVKATKLGSYVLKFIWEQFGMPSSRSLNLRCLGNHILSEF